MDPCAWCVLQRLIFSAVGVAALVGLAWRSDVGRALTAGVATLLADLGIAAAAWQHVVASKSASCNLTLADRVMDASSLPSLLPAVFEARASCADAAVSLAGVPYDVWAMVAFALCSGCALMALLTTFRRPRR